MWSIDTVIPVLLSDVTSNFRCSTSTPILSLRAVGDAVGSTKQLTNSLLRITCRNQWKTPLVTTVERNGILSRAEGYNRQENANPPKATKREKNQTEQESQNNRDD